MKLISNRWIRGFLLASVYAVGVFGIIASSDGDGDIRLDFTCDLSFRGIAPVTDGTVWAGVLSQSTDGSVDGVVLLDTDGSELANFVIGPGGNDNAVRAVALAADGTADVYVGGDFTGGILRLEDDGSLDPGFAVVGTGFNGRVTAVVPLPNGDVYVGGFFSRYNGVVVSGLVRLKNDGSRDNGFVAVGVTNVESVAMSGPLSTDDVYSGGQNIPRIARWDSNGTPDNTFDPLLGAGTVLNVTPVLAGFNAGDIYLGGNFGNRILRINNDGSLDPLFNNNIGTGFDADVLSISLAAANDIYVGGLFTAYEGTGANGVVRLNDNGSRDFDFSIGSGFTDPNDSFAFSKVTSVAQATDGSLDVFVGGGFSDYEGSAVNGIARLDVDGSLDSVFAVRITVDGETCSNQTITD